MYAWVSNSGVNECTDFFFFVRTPNDWIVKYKLSRLTHFFTHKQILSTSFVLYLCMYVNTYILIYIRVKK